MENLRDRCLEHFELLAKGKWRAPSLQTLQAEVAELNEHQREIARRCIVASLDSAIHDFLFKLQEQADFENDIQVIVDGENVVPLSDGIHGEPYGDDGWQARFSKYGVRPDQA
jgi:hypothetical protein